MPYLYLLDDEEWLFLGNHNDLDTCTIKALESLAAMIDHKMEEYSVKMPHKLRRVMDLLSIKRSRLWGTYSKHQHDFDKNEQWSNPDIGPNLGKQISLCEMFEKTNLEVFGALA